MSDNILTPVITLDGMRAVTTAYENGTVIDISQIAVGDGNGDGYAPSQSQSTLVNETQRVSILSRNKVTDKHIRMLAVLDGATNYFIRELGIFLADGTLFAVWSSDQIGLGEKTELVPFDLAFDLIIDQIPADVINVIVEQPDFNLQIIPELAILLKLHANHVRREFDLTLRIEALEQEVNRLRGRDDLLQVQITHQHDT